MSKRELKQYLKGLNKIQVEEQILELYNRFKDVKEYYDFAFNPKENVLMEQCRFQIGKEYFPVKGRKAKARRSVAQKWIKKLKLLNADPTLIADIMLFNIEIAQAWANEKKTVFQELFFRSMLKSFDESLIFISENGLISDFTVRVEKIVAECLRQKWPNRNQFEKVAELYIFES